MRVAVLAHGFATWGGGIHFLRIVVDALCAVTSQRDLQIFVLNPGYGPLSVLRTCSRFVKGLASHAPASSWRQIYAARENVRLEFSELEGQVAVAPIDYGDRALKRALQALAIDVVVPSMEPLGRDFPVPWVGYLYDFQHKYLARLFSDAERASRDADFIKMLSQAPAVIVNAQTVKRDAEQFFPNFKSEIFVLPFAAAPRPDWFNDAADLINKYSIKPPYFIISNQFWLHKGHATAFEAFKLIAHEFPELSLVCTGNTHDPRDAQYFPSLIDKLSRDGLKSRVHILGMIKKRDQIELMKHALAVLQPTSFEGGPGGGAAYDAISLGVQVIASDIDVNKELGDEPGVRFFETGNAAALAAEMRAAFHAHASPAPAEQLIEAGERRRLRCGLALLRAIDFVRASRPI